MNLRSQIVRELKEANNKEKTKMMQYLKESNKELLEARYESGPFSKSAKEAHEARAKKLKTKRENIEFYNKWKDKMLSKYVY